MRQWLSACEQLLLLSMAGVYIRVSEHCGLTLFGCEMMCGKKCVNVHGIRLSGYFTSQ